MAKSQEKKSVFTVSGPERTISEPGNYKNTVKKLVEVEIEMSANDVFNWLVECQDPETLRYLGRAALRFAAGLENPDDDDFRSRA